jgi:hypothetical protein
VGRPSATRAQKRELAGSLKTELQRQIELGKCVYCGTAASPQSPLTREHVIPRARGGRRKDVRIIVPACARCNHHRGCGDLIPFLLTRPQRISSFLDYLDGLSPASMRQVDLRVYAELYAAVAILAECAGFGQDWRSALERICAGRSLHRRRYAARRTIWLIAGRFQLRDGVEDGGPGPSCPLRRGPSDPLPLHLDEPLERLAARLLSLFSLMWAVPAEVIDREMMRELAGSAARPGGSDDHQRESASDGAEDEVLQLDAWAGRRRRKRLRVDRRNGRAPRARSTASARGRAA